MPVFYLNGTGRERQATWITLLSCGVCYVLMLGGLYVFHSPVALVQGMTGACLTVPVWIVYAARSIYGREAAAGSIAAMVPVFAAIGLVYASSVILVVLLLIAGGWALYGSFICLTLSTGTYGGKS